MRNTTENISAKGTRVLKTDAQYRAALTEAEELIQHDPELGTVAADRLELLTLLLEHYESEHFQFGTPDPVEAIEFRMEEQGLKQKDLVPYLGSRSRVSEILSRKRPLTVQMIRALSSGLGIPLEALVNTPRPESDVQERVWDWAKLPVREMEKRGWFEDLKAKVKGSAEEVVCEYFKLAMETQPLFRRRLRGEELEERAYYSTLAWTARVLVRSRSQESCLANYERAHISHETFRELARLSWLDDGPRLAVEYLSKLGVAVVVEPKLPNCVFDGAAMISERAVPVIGLTLRLDRIDYFWFTLLHELAHVWLHLSDTSESFIDRMESSDADSLVEREANKVARDGLIPPSVWKRSEAFLNPTAESIRRLADDLHIHPAIVAGRVQFESKRYERFRELLGQGKVRNHFSDVF